MISGSYLEVREEVWREEILGGQQQRDSVGNHSPARGHLGSKEKGQGLKPLQHLGFGERRLNQPNSLRRDGRRTQRTAGPRRHGS